MLLPMQMYGHKSASAMEIERPRIHLSTRKSTCKLQFLEVPINNASGTESVPPRRRWSDGLSNYMTLILTKSQPQSHESDLT